MRTTPPVVKCALCGNDTRLTISHTYWTHKGNDGYRCLATGDTRDQAIQRRRTFRDKNARHHSLEIFDNTDSVGFHYRHIGDNDRMETWVYLPDADVRRMIAELLEIAATRGL